MKTRDLVGLGGALCWGLFTAVCGVRVDGGGGQLAVVLVGGVLGSMSFRYVYDAAVKS